MDSKVSGSTRRNRCPEEEVTHSENGSVPPRHIRELRSLTRRLEKITRMMTSIKNSILSQVNALSTGITATYTDPFGLGGTKIIKALAPAKLVVHMVQQSKVGCLHAVLCFGGEVDAGSRDIILFAKFFRFWGHSPVANHRIRHAGPEIALEVECRWMEWRVGCDESEGQEEWACGIAGLHEPQSPLHRPVGLV